jgi:hypothetical protein
MQERDERQRQEVYSKMMRRRDSRKQWQEDASAIVVELAELLVYIYNGSTDLRILDLVAVRKPL